MAERLTSVEIASALANCLEMCSLIKPLELHGMNFGATKERILDYIAVLSRQDASTQINMNGSQMKRQLVAMQTELMAVMEKGWEQEAPN